jgi:hypothetical protein
MACLGSRSLADKMRKLLRHVGLLMGKSRHALTPSVKNTTIEAQQDLAN